MTGCWILGMISLISSDINGDKINRGKFYPKKLCTDSKALCIINNSNTTIFKEAIELKWIRLFQP